MKQRAFVYYTITKKDSTFQLSAIIKAMDMEIANYNYTCDFNQLSTTWNAFIKDILMLRDLRGFALQGVNLERQTKKYASSLLDFAKTCSNGRIFYYDTVFFKPKNKKERILLEDFTIKDILMHLSKDENFGKEVALLARNRRRSLYKKKSQLPTKKSS